MADRGAGKASTICVVVHKLTSMSYRAGLSEGWQILSLELVCLSKEG